MTSIRDPLKTSAIRVVSKDGTDSKWMYLSADGSMTTSAVNESATDWVPMPMKSLFNTSGVALTPPIPQGQLPERGTSYVNLRIQLDGMLGPLSTVRSLAGSAISSVVVVGNELNFSYTGSVAKEILEITSCNFNWYRKSKICTRV